MTRHDFIISQRLMLDQYSTKVLLMTAMQTGTEVEVGRLAAMFPELHAEVVARAATFGGALPSDPKPAEQKPARARRVPRGR